ncbi:MAG TPA: GAF domain-containing protein [Gaiella sp.]
MTREVGEAERLALLVEASRRLLGPLTLGQALEGVLGVARQALAADAHGLWRHDPRTGIWRIEAADGLSESYRELAAEEVSAPQVTVSLDGPIAVEDIDRAEFLNPGHRQLHREEGNRAMLAIPLRHGADVLGTLVFYYRSTRRFSDVEIRAATALAHLATAAIVSAELDEGGRRLAEDRRFLSEAGELLASSLDHEATLANVAALAVPRFADWCTVDLVEPDGSIGRVAVAHADPDRTQWATDIAQRHPIDPESPFGAAAVLRTGRSQLASDITDEQLVRAASGGEELLAALREIGLRSAMIVPLVARGHVLGTITFASAESGRRYGEDDLALVEELARRAAVAVDNARLYRDEQEARAAAERVSRRLEFLSEASVALASSLDVERTLATVAELVVPRFADWCAVDLARDDGTIWRVAIVHQDPEKAVWADESRRIYPPAPDEAEGSARAIRESRPLLYAEVPDQLLRESAVDVRHYEVMSQLGLRAAMVVPLIARERTLGALTFAAGSLERAYDEEQLDFVADLARRIATAVDNAILHRQAEDALQQQRESLALLDTLFGTAPVGLAFFDRELRFVRVNQALAEINGPSVEEHVGRLLEEVLPELGPSLAERYRRVLATDEPDLEVEVRGETPAAPGKERIWQSSYYPVRTSENVLLGLGVVVSDVTERRFAERAERFLARASDVLASSLDYERTLRAVAVLAVPELAGQCIVDLLEEDGSLRCVASSHVDPDKQELLRRLRDEFPPTTPGHPVQAALRSGDARFLPQLDDEAIVSMAHNEQHAAAIRELANTSGIVAPLVARGRILGAITLGSVPPQLRFTPADVELASELARRAATAVDNALLYRAAEERAQAALALAYVDDGVFLLDEADVVRLWNPAAEAITGLPAADVVGEDIGDVLAGWADLAPNIPVTLESVARSSRPQTLPLELGGRELWLSISGVRFADGTVYAFRDVTEERAVERLKSDFVSTVSHELRTPLAAIYGAALTLRRTDIRLEESQQSGLLDVIASEADQLARIVNDILWASRLDAGTMGVAIRSCDATSLARQMVEAARAHAPAGVALVLSTPEDLPPVAVDPDKIRQVIANLLDNAIKYSPDGGRVELTLSQADARVRFRVSDEGLGIPPAEHERIFEKFYRLDPQLTRGVGGTGLGLYICRELVHRMHGRIWVESDGQAGSSFFVDLPVG